MNLTLQGWGIRSNDEASSRRGIWRASPGSWRGSEQVLPRQNSKKSQKEVSAAALLKRLEGKVPNQVSVLGENIMSQFVFLYRGGQRSDSPEQSEKVMQKWVDWMQELAQRGHMKDRGQPLELQGKVVKGKQKVITDGPYAESKDLVGGYTLIEAKDLAQAAELSKGCPIFETDGVVEVRPVMEM